MRRGKTRTLDGISSATGTQAPHADFSRRLRGRHDVGRDPGIPNISSLPGFRRRTDRVHLLMRDARRERTTVVCVASPGDDTAFSCYGGSRRRSCGALAFAPRGLKCRLTPGW